MILKNLRALCLSPLCQQLLVKHFADPMPLLSVGPLQDSVGGSSRATISCGEQTLEVD